MRIRLKVSRLRHRLARSRLSQNAWAKRLRIGSGHLSRLVNGKRVYPSPETRRKLLEGLGLSFDELFEVEVAGKPAEASGRPPRPAGQLQQPNQETKRNTMSTFLQDLKFAGRVFRVNKSFSAVAVLTLALGIGAGTAIFSIVNGILLRPLPYPNGDRIHLALRMDSDGNLNDQFQLEKFEEWQRRSQSFNALSAVGFVSNNLTGGKEPEQLRLGLVSSDFFRVMGLSPSLGRGFSDEDQASNRALAVLSNRLWQRQFAASQDVLGRSIELDGVSFTVVGVLPEEFQYPQWADLLVPLGDGSRRAGGAPTVRVVGRLSENAQSDAAAQEMEALVLRLGGEPAAEDEASKIQLVSLLEDTVGDTRPALLTLMGAVGFLLLIACTNVAGLLLARGAARRREMAVRLSLGASPARIWRQLLTESLCLAVAGGGAGLLLANWGVAALKGFSTLPVPRMEEVQVDWTVALFSLAVSLLVGVAFGLLPAWQASRRSSPLNLSLKGRAADLGGWRLRRFLVAAQVAMALVLLVGAGLMLRSFQALRQVELGFQTSVLTAGLQLPRDKYPQGTQVAAFYRSAVERLEAQAEVASAAACNFLPLYNASMQASLTPIGEESTPEQQFKPLQRVVTPGFFEAMDIPLLAGRGFEWSDDAQRPPVLVVNNIAARRFWPDGKPVGRDAIVSLQGKPVRMTVVGVVGTIHGNGPRGPAEAEIYAPHAQNPWLYMNLIVRGQRTTDPALLAPLVRQTVHDLDPERPLFAVGTLQSVLDIFLMTEPRLLSIILTAFACSALLLALVGLYALISFLVAQRIPEIGTRMALGATGSDILRSVVGQGAALIALGLGVGLAAAAALTRFLAEQLFRVGALDPSTFSGAAILLLAVGLLACFFPARRAAQIDPVKALRSE